MSTKNKNIPSKKASGKDEDFSSIDRSLVKDLMKSEESDETRSNHQPKSNSNDQEIHMENQDPEEDPNNQNMDSEDQDEAYNPHFTGEVVNIEEEEQEDSETESKLKQTGQVYSNQDQHSQNDSTPTKFKRNDMYSSENLMERISEAEYEDEKQHNTIFDKLNSELMKEDYRINEQNFDEIMNQELNSKNVKNLFNPTLYNTENSYKFKPSISKNSQLIINQKRNNKSQDSVTVSSSSKTPIELELYKDAVKRKEKLQKIEYNNMMAIILNSSKTKISNNSHRIAINKIEKIIDESVMKFEKDKKLSFINVGEVLTDLKIFREIFPDKKQKEKDDKKYQSYKDIKLELNNVKEIERRKKSEVDFFEQLWITLNPDNKDYIKSDIFSEFQKILFSPVASSVKEISSILKQFLLAAFFLSSNPEENKYYISPITEKQLTEDDIWPLDKLVKEFLKLKDNILAYQNIQNNKKRFSEELEKASKLKQESYKSRSNFWEERLNALMDREKLRLQVLEEMKKDNDQNLLKECTFKPQINKKSTLVQDDHGRCYNSDQPVYDKLYLLHKEKEIKRLKEAEESKVVQAHKELEGCTFQPQFVSQKTYEKCITSVEKPKGFTQTVDRLRRGIIETMKKKYLVKKIPTGENYEKIKRANIKPFNITDLKRKDELENEKDKEESKDDMDDYFSIQVTIPSGKERTLKVHKDDDPYEIADNFCKVYGMKEEIKQRLAKTISQFMHLYLIRSNEKSQINDQPNLSSNNQLNNFSQNNLNLDEI